ncbi:MAG: SH3 domain-containing protein, partial [Chloroflexota bacterium]
TFSESGQFLNIIELYDPNNNSISQFLLSAVDFAESAQIDSPRIVPQEYIWVEHNARAMIAVLFSDGSWRVIDPANGNQFELADAPSLIASNGNGTVLTPTHTPATSDGGSNIAWQVEHSNGTLTTFNTSAWRLSTPPAISPDGNYVVTNGLGAVDFRRVDGTADGGIIFNPNPEIMRFNDPYSVVWTPMRWVTNVESGDIVPTPSVPNPDNNSNTACNAPDRISIGDFATINAGLPNNVRATASINGTYLGVLPAGLFFTIADGPVCANGLRWWQVQTEGGLIGWTAEASADGNPWILPLAGSPLANTTPEIPNQTSVKPVASSVCSHGGLIFGLWLYPPARMIITCNRLNIIPANPAMPVITQTRRRLSTFIVVSP